MEHIVVGFDGTGPSLVAVDWAAERAARGPCRVEIITVEHEDLLAEPLDVVTEAERRIRDAAPDTEVTIRTVAGRMPHSLLRAVGAPDLLVIGAHRRRPVRSALTGRMPLRTVAHSRVATVVVPEDWRSTEGRILVGVDDDDSSSAAVPFAAREADQSGAGLTLLHAWQMPLPTTEGAGALLAVPAHVKAGHQEVLDEAARDVAALCPAVDLEVVLVKDNPSSALVTRSARASLLVLGTHQRGLMQGAIVGSVCQDVLWSSQTPVCVVPAAGSGH
jgi:nucleotide-binding universal stress UspA family protein